MIMMGDKKKAVDAILGPLDGKKPEAKPNALHAIAEEMIEAIQAKDAAGLESALRAAYAECGMVGDEQEE